jgi:hypothetical protein
MESLTMFKEVDAALPGTGKPDKCNVFADGERVFGDLFFKKDPLMAANQIFKLTICEKTGQECFNIKIGRIRTKRNNRIVSWTKI